MFSESVNRSIEGDKEFLDFVEENLEILLREGRSFVVCSREDIPPILINKDENGIWIAFLSELNGV